MLPLLIMVMMIMMMIMLIRTLVHTCITALDFDVLKVYDLAFGLAVPKSVNIQTTNNLPLNHGKSFEKPR